MNDTTIIQSPDNIFNKLNAINVNDKIEKKKRGDIHLSYLPWASAFEILLSSFADKEIEYDVIENPNRELPIFGDAQKGYIVKTWIKIRGVTRKMWLPITDNKNNVMKDESYEYKDNKNNKVIVNPINTFAINTAIMRCFVKNIAKFGVGLYVYKGEDLPTNEIIIQTPLNNNESLSKTLDKAPSKEIIKLQKLFDLKKEIVLKNNINNRYETIDKFLKNEIVLPYEKQLDAIKWLESL